MSFLNEGEIHLVGGTWSASTRSTCSTNTEQPRKPKTLRELLDAARRNYLRSLRGRGLL